MKKILTVIMFVVICLVANAQEVHGYNKVFVHELTSVGFLVTDSGYTRENLDDDVPDTYRVMLLTPSYYNEEQTRLAIVTLLNRYEDVILTQPWQTVSYKKGKCDGSVAAYKLCDDTQLTIFIADTSESKGRCTVALYECIVKKQ